MNRHAAPFDPFRPAHPTAPIDAGLLLNHLRGLLAAIQRMDDRLARLEQAQAPPDPARLTPEQAALLAIHDRLPPLARNTEDEENHGTVPIFRSRRAQ